MAWNKRSGAYGVVKTEIDGCISSVGKVMGGGAGDWASQLRGMAELKPRIEAVTTKIAQSEGSGDITSDEAAELRLSLQERLKQYGISVQPS